MMRHVSVPLLSSLFLLASAAPALPATHVASEGDSSSALANFRQLVVCTVDGNVHSLDLGTGIKRWSLELPASDSMFSASSPSSSSALRGGLSQGVQAADSEGIPRPTLVPSVDGSLFAYIPPRSSDERHGMIGETLVKRLPISVPEIVARAPFVGPDGVLYLGDRQSVIYTVDAVLGRVRGVLTHSAAVGGSAGTTHGGAPTPPGEFRIGRVDYTVKAVDPTSSSELWNVTLVSFVQLHQRFLEWSSASSGAGASAALKKASLALGGSLYASPDGFISMISDDGLTTLWRTKLPSPAMAAYVLGNDMRLDKVLLSFATQKAVSGGGVEVVPISDVHIGSHNGQLFAFPASDSGWDVPFSQTTSTSTTTQPRLPYDHSGEAVGRGEAAAEYYGPWHVLPSGWALAAASSFIVGALSVIGSWFFTRRRYKKRMTDSIAAATSAVAVSSPQPTQHNGDAPAAVTVAANPARLTSPTLVPPPLPPSPSTVPADAVVAAPLPSKPLSVPATTEAAPEQVKTPMAVSTKPAEVRVQDAAGVPDSWEDADDSAQTQQQKDATGARESEHTAATAATTTPPSASPATVTPKKQQKRKKKAKAAQQKEAGGTEPILTVTPQPQAPAAAVSKPQSPSSGQQALRVGKMEVYTKNILGRGSVGTVVFEGMLDGRRIAVKRLLKEFYSIAKREISLLLESDEHPNLVRYFATEEDNDFVYLALTYCTGTLADWTERIVRDPSRPVTPSMVQMMLDIASDIHSLNIVHRDLKPQNILVDLKGRGRISDMGLAKKFEGTHFSYSIGNAGSTGWMAPEIVLLRTQEPAAERSNSTGSGNATMTKAMDIFALGCIFYYIATGTHPFGDRLERDVNIASGKCDMSGLWSSPELLDLVEGMTKHEPSERMTADEVLSHPFFWDSSRKLQFMLAASDRLEVEKPTAPIVTRFEVEAAKGARFVKWDRRLDVVLLDDLTHHRKYNFDAARDLLRVLRNKANHFYDLPDGVRATLGSLPDGFMEYFGSRFPSLVITTYRYLLHTCYDEPVFASYFPH